MEIFQWIVFVYVVIVAIIAIYRGHKEFNEAKKEMQDATRMTGRICDILEEAIESGAFKKWVNSKKEIK